MVRNFISVFGMLCCLLAPDAQARDLTERAFQSWLQDSFRSRARSAGIASATFDRALGNVQLQLDLPELVARPSQKDAQTEFNAPSAYFRESLLARVVRDGKAVAAREKTALAMSERKSGVPAHILLGIWGRESAFGQAAIPHDAFAVLATKAYAGRRSGYFEQELLAALKMLERPGVLRSKMRSSWAGAMGQPQFMPSSYLKYGADGDGDGRSDIWSSVPDITLSIGRYLADHGWTRGRDWGFEVVVPASVSCAMEGQENGRTIAEWQKMGVQRVAGKAFPAHELKGQGFLLMPAGRAGPAFVVTPNFFVLKQYNNSDLYALFVGHSGDRIAYGMGAFRAPWQRVDTFTREQITRLQKRLVGLGYDVGGVDGLVGTKTRRAIGQWQQANGLAPTCYPGNRLIRQILR